MTTAVSHRPSPRDLGKPRMRGWLHTYAFFVAVVCGIVLCSLAATRPGIAPLVSCVIYSLTVCGLFGVSALYHRRVWTPSGFQIMRRLDHSMIFVFIAGTYTPFSVLLLPPGKATLILAVVWGGALAGVVMKMIWPHVPALGVRAALHRARLGRRHRPAGLPALRRRRRLVLLLVGGLAYSVGAVFYALRRPNPWPTVFGHHEFFHACTLVAALCHHIALYFALF